VPVVNYVSQIISFFFLGRRRKGRGQSGGLLFE
jgi:hypothetical protein